MYCAFCGKQILDDAVFCRYCGKPILQGDELAGLAAEAPDSQILHAALASQPMGAAQGAGTAGAEAGTEEVGAAAAAGGLGAVKIGIIALAAVAVVGLGIFGVTRIVSRSAEIQEPSTIEKVIEQKEPYELDELEASEEPAPIDEALEQYRIIIGQADNYEYETSLGLESTGYRYALVQMRPDDLVPTLLLEMDTEIFTSYARVFQYDPDTKTVRQPAETVTEGASGAGGYRGSLAMAGDRDGIMSTEWFSGTGETTVSRITLDGDSLNREIYWTGRIDLMPESITFIEIEWHEVEDLSALDNWITADLSEAAPSEPSETVDSGTLPTDEGRIVLTGTVGTYDYDEIIALQGQPDPNAECYSEDYREYARSMIYHVIVLSSPQILRLHSGDGEDVYSREQRAK